MEDGKSVTFAHDPKSRLEGVSVSLLNAEVSVGLTLRTDILSCPCIHSLQFSQKERLGIES